MFWVLYNNNKKEYALHLFLIRLILLQEMDSIAIVIQHSGQWDVNRINYINFEVCGLLIPNSCTYNNLVGIICEQLKLQPESTVLKIEYQVREGYPTFKIVDDS